MRNTISRAPAFASRTSRHEIPHRTYIGNSARTHVHDGGCCCCLPTRVTTFSDHSARYRSSCPAVHAPRRRGTWRTYTWWRARCFAFAQSARFPFQTMRYTRLDTPWSLTIDVYCASRFTDLFKLSHLLCICDLKRLRFYLS